MLTQDRYLVNFTKGEVYELNQLGYEIINALLQGKNLNEIVEEISEKYLVSREKVEKDVTNFLQVLQDEDVIEVVEDEK